MPSQQPSLKTFLATTKEALAAPPEKRSLPFTFVVGNESADLDSLCSAVVLAFIRSITAPQRLHIPLSNIPRADLALRLELGPVLSRAGVGASDLITLTELPDNLDPKDTEWILVDHNCLTGPLQKFDSRIIGCIDHHVDEGTISVQALPRIIETCGSCMSLIVHKYAKEWRDIIQRQGSVSREFTQLAQVAMAPILIDTINLTDPAKVRPKDQSAAKLLEAEFMEDPNFDPTTYYEAINAGKEDLSQLSLRDILRKDYKEWDEGGIKLGISCSVQNLDFLLEKAITEAGSAAKGPEVLLRELATWAEERKVDIASIMTTSNAGGVFQRHLLVWGVTDASKKAVKRFKDDATDKLQLTEWHDGLLDGDGPRFAWRQYELSASRKQVAPLLRDAMKWAGANL